MAPREEGSSSRDETPNCKCRIKGALRLPRKPHKSPGESLGKSERKAGTVGSVESTPSCLAEFVLFDLGKPVAP